jgi:hypothetical protein
VRLCKVSGCGKKHAARGLCQAHYAERKRRKAGVEARGTPKPRHIDFYAEDELVERFHRLVPDRKRAALLRRLLARYLKRLEKRLAITSTPASP